MDQQGVAGSDLPGPLVPDEATLEGLRSLVASHARQPSLFRNTRDVVALFRTDGKVVTANLAAMTISGFGPGELAGREFRQQITQTHVDLVVQNFRRAVRGETVEFELSITHKSGRRVDIAAMLIPAIYEDGIVGVYAVGKDVSELKAADREFDRQIQELSSLIQHHPDSLVALDRTGTITRVNGSLEALVGYGEHEMIGRRYTHFVAPDTLLEAASIFARALAGEHVRATMTLVHRSGRRIETAGAAVAIKVDGEIVGIYAIGHDVTDQRRLEASVAEHADRLRDLSIVAATTGRDPDAVIVAALELGSRTLHCEMAFVARVHDRIVSLTRSIGFEADPLPPRALAESLVRFPMQTGDVFAVDDLAAPPWNATLGKDDPLAVGFYAVPVEAGGLRYGAVAFLSRHRRTVTFSSSDREFLRLVGALVGSAVERSLFQRRNDLPTGVDALGEPPNRGLLTERLAAAVGEARHRGTSIAVHLIGFTGFAELTRSHGKIHALAVLRSLAHRFDRVTRESDLVARADDERFVVVQTALDDDDAARRLAERLIEAIGAPLEADGHVHRMTASIGIAVAPRDGSTATELLQHADDALLTLRGEGGVALATPSS